jgi:hypothetical protein
MKLLDIPPKYLNRELSKKIYNNKSLMKKYIKKYDLVGGKKRKYDDTVEWNISAMDGTFPVFVSKTTTVFDMKIVIANNKNKPLDNINAIILFETGNEEPLENNKMIYFDTHTLFLVISHALAIPQLFNKTVLMILYNETNGPSWDPVLNWNIELNLEDWIRVQIDDDDNVEIDDNNNVQIDKKNDVIGIQMISTNMRGPIPKQLKYLEHLTLLVLNNDQNAGLTGEIPPELGELSNLELLSLEHNQLTGPIPPELGSASKLIELDLGSNKLEGEIPKELGKLHSLEILYLNKNNLTLTIANKNLENLLNLEVLDLSWNAIEGEIPSFITKLTKLKFLNLSNNILEGTIPDDMNKLTLLQTLDLSYNTELSGDIPKTLTDMEMLKVVYLTATGITIDATESFLPEIKSIFNFDYLAPEKAPYF